MATGIIEAVAKDFFDSKVTMSIYEQPQEEERTGKLEHVVFLMTQISEVQRHEEDGGDKREEEDTAVSGITQHYITSLY